MKFILAAATVAATTLCSAPTAAADNDSYLWRLQNEYGTVYDTGLSLATGYTICARLGYENGADTATWLYYAGGNDVPTLEGAARWVVIAAQELCPWMDHSGQRQQLLEAV